MHPILFHLRLASHDVPIYGYGTMLGLALLAGWYAAVRSARRIPLDSVTAGNVYASILLASLFAARAGYLLANLRSFESFADALSPTHGGLLGLGAAVGGLAAGAYLSRRLDLPAARLADHAMPALATIAAIVRVGCYLYGCDHGRLLGSAAPGFLKSLGRFPRVVDPNDSDRIVGSPAYLQQMGDPNGSLALDATTALPVHPTQLYELLLALAVLALASYRLPRSKTNGDVALPCVALYGLGRVAIEPLRADVDRGFVFGASVTMVASAIAAFAAVVVLIVRARKAPVAHA